MKVKNINFAKDISTTLWLKTFSILLTFGVMGLCSALIGTTYVHLEHLFEVTSKQVSYSLVVLSIGYLIGAVLCGVIYDKLPIPELGFFSANILASFATMGAGMMHNFNLFLFAMSLQGVAFGYNDAGGQTYCINSWKGKKYQKSVLQSIHAFWSAGGVLGPLLVKIFLVEIAGSLKSEMNQLSSNGVNQSIEILSNTLMHTTENTHETIKHDGIKKSRYAYIIFGIIALMPAISFLFLYLKAQCDSLKSSKIPLKIYISENAEKTENQKELISTNNLDDISQKSITKFTSEKSLSFIKYITFLISIAVFSNFNLYMENLPVGFLVSFSLKYLQWSILDSSRLLSCYYASHLIGRLMAIVVSIWIKPKSLLAFNLSITCLAYVLMMFVGHWKFVIWISVILAGFGVSTTFPTSVLWVTEYVKMDGKLGSLLIVSSSIGTITGPYIMSIVTLAYGPFVYVYLLLIASIIHIFVFIAQLIFIKMCL